MKLHKSLICVLALIIIMSFAGIITYYAKSHTKDDSAIKNIETQNPNTKTTELNKLDEIENLQKKYFEIIKRNNALLVLNDNINAKTDLKELKSLFTEVKSKADKNNAYYKKYEEIKLAYSINTGTNTFEMNDFARKNYEEVDKLLNDVYSELKSKLSENEFEKLKISENNWLKEVENYNSVFEAQNFGTIGTLVKFDYEINMRCFRILLLLMLL